MDEPDLRVHEWQSALLETVVTEATAGDWGEPAPLDKHIECRVLRGTDFHLVATGYFDGAPIRYIRESSLAARRLVPDDFLVELSGGSEKQPTGRLLHVSSQILGRSHHPVLYSNFVKRIRIDIAKLEPAFFSLYWSFLYGLGKTRTYQKRTTGIWSFKLADFLRSELTVLPPLYEQRAIVVVVRTVQRAKEACERVITATRAFKQSLLHHLFTYGPVPFDQVHRVPLKEVDTGLAPKRWDLTTLGALIADGPQNGVYKPQSDYGDGTPIVRIDAFPNEGGIVTSAAKRVGLNADERATYSLRVGDLLINRVNSLSHLGKTALVGPMREQMVFESNMMRLSLDSSKVLPEFVFRFLCCPGPRDMLRSASKRAVAQSSVNQGDVRSLTVPLPLISEQRAIVASLAAMDLKLSAEEARSAALDRLFHSLLHNLMTGQVRVNHLVEQLDAEAMR